jgi:hypothetical protein
VELQTNDIASFRITNIDLEEGSPDITDDIDNIFAQCKVGELGYRVDPAVTRVIQQGIENSRTPCLDRTPGELGLFSSNHRDRFA